MKLFHYLFTQKVCVIKWQLNLFGVSVLFIGITIGFYLTVSNFIMPIFADTATSVSKETDTDFSQGALVDTEVSGSGNGAVVRLEGGGGSDWYSGNWQYRKGITIDHTKIDGDLTNFPVLVSLNSDSDLAVDAQDDFDDILFADVNKTKLDHEIEEYNESTGQLIAWVRVLSLSSSADTDIYLYYGNGACSNQEDAEEVWDDDYEMVQHLEETSGQHFDSTSNDNDGSPQGGVTQDATGKISGANSFDGSGDYVSVADSASLDITNAVTMEVWVKINNYPTAWNLLTMKGNTSSQRAYGMWIRNIGDILTSYYNGGWYHLYPAGQGFTTETWHHVVGVIDTVNNHRAIYIDNVLKANSNSAIPALSVNNLPLYIGSATGTWPTNGLIDEVRISSTARSAEWISASYENQDSPSDFYDLGSEQSALAPTGTYESPTDSNAINIIYNGAWGDGTDSSTAFSSTVASVGVNSSITFQMRTADTSANLSSAVYQTLGTANSGTTFTRTKAELDALAIPTGTAGKYVQVKTTLTSSDGVTNPQLDNFTIYYMADDTAPETNASSVAMKKQAGGDDMSSNDWTNDLSPYFSWTAGSDSQSGLKGYCLYLGTDPSGDPATAKGFLGTSPVSTAGTTCQFIINATSIDLDTASYRGSPWITSSAVPYYLNVKAIDLANNIYNSMDAQFQFRFDNISPSNPSGLSAPQTYQSAINGIAVYWSASGETAAEDNHSGVKGYQYRIGDSGTWYGSSHSGNEDCDDVIVENSCSLDETYDLLVTGENTFYLRTWDNSCNVSVSAITAILKYSGDSPTEPQNLSADPSTNTENSFAFSWEAPQSYSGQESGLSYGYTINAVPSSVGCVWTSSTSLLADAYATQPGDNTFYVTTKDEAGNVNYDAYSSISFTANTSAPGVVRSIDVADISIKATNNWKLVASWEAPENVGSGVENYKVYRSTTSNSCASGFSSFLEVGTTAGTSYSDVGLTQQTYYYCVKACDSANNCSAVSSTVSGYPDGKFTEAAELISDPSTCNVTTKRATISWSTDRTADSKIAYGKKSKDYYDEEPSNSTQVTDHEIKLTSLDPGTRYYYKAKWTDEDGNTGVSDEKSFRTDNAPTVKDVSTTRAGIDNATIEFTTKGALKAKIYYGRTTEFGGVKEISTSASEATYTVNLIGLQDGTKYYYQINTFDSEDDEYSGTILDFETLPRPKISNVRIQQVKGTAQPTILVTWNTNTEISSIITYQPEGDSSQSRDEVNVKLVSGEHKMVIRNLLPQTAYMLIVKGVDKMGNQAVSDSQKITTATDTRPPQISQLSVEGSNTSPAGNSGQEAVAQLIVSWNTDEPATSQVEFGEGSGATYSQKTQEDTNLTNNHLVIISGLSPSKVYHLRAITTDDAGNEAKSVDTVTITPKATDNAFDLVVNNLREIFGFLEKI